MSKKKVCHSRVATRLFSFPNQVTHSNSTSHQRHHSTFPPPNPLKRRRTPILSNLTHPNTKRAVALYTLHTLYAFLPLNPGTSESVHRRSRHRCNSPIRIRLRSRYSRSGGKGRVVRVGWGRVGVGWGRKGSRDCHHRWNGATISISAHVPISAFHTPRPSNPNSSNTSSSRRRTDRRHVGVFGTDTVVVAIRAGDGSDWVGVRIASASVGVGVRSVAVPSTISSTITRSRRNWHVAHITSRSGVRISHRRLPQTPRRHLTRPRTRTGEGTDPTSVIQTSNVEIDVVVLVIAVEVGGSVKICGVKLGIPLGVPPMSLTVTDDFEEENDEDDECEDAPDGGDADDGGFGEGGRGFTPSIILRNIPCWGLRWWVELSTRHRRCQSARG